MTFRVWIVSELYYPEQTSTGYFLTGIAEALATEFSTSVLCSQPTYSGRGILAPRSEVRHGASIFRCRGSRFDPRWLPGRLINATTISAAVFWNVLRRVGRNDLVITVTNPPLLPLVARVACRLRGARPLLLVHDVYPEVLFAAGLLGERSVTGRFVARASRLLYHGFEHVVVLGRDMRELIAAKGVDPRRISIIPNWGEADRVRPRSGENALRQQLGLSDDTLVVQFMGNIGRTHALDALLEAAGELEADRRVHVLIIGSGSRQSEVASAAATRGNVTFLPPVPAEELETALGAADLAVIPLAKGMRGVSVPSRTYNALAAGLPIVAMADEGSELALLIREERAGWIVPSGDAAGLVRAVLQAARDRSELADMARRARAAAERTYARPLVLARWVELIRSMASRGGAVPTERPS